MHAAAPGEYVEWLPMGLVAGWSFRCAEVELRVHSGRCGCTSDGRAASIGGLFAKGALYVGLVCAAVGAPFGAAAARILKGNAPENDIVACGAALAYFCLQVPFLSLNGVCEACAHARADARALSLLSGVHVACAVLFALCARPALATTGPPGLVAAGGGVMALRALVALYLARARAFSKHGAAFVKAAAPDAVALFVFLGAGAAARRSASIASLATHVAATAVLGVSCLAAIFVRDRAFVTSLLGSRRAKKAD